LSNKVHIRTALRRHVCRQCAERPSGSERWSDDRERPCETACQVFVFAPGLMKMAVAGSDEQDHVLSLPQACGACNLQDDSGHCAAAGNGTCPLCRYSDEVLETLRRVAAREAGSRG